MMRVNNQDFFVHEPTYLRSRSVCMPMRWIIKDQVPYGVAHPMQPYTSDTGGFWIVDGTKEITVPASDFLVPFMNWSHFGETSVLPSGINIRGKINYPLVLWCSQTLGVFQGEDRPLEQWDLTTSSGNAWRTLAQGHRVVSFPIFLYCDDTSGNMSKKWNEHNSFLFSAAGLPQEKMHEEYNIHFLCTSNSARPLEMLDGIVDQLE